MVTTTIAVPASTTAYQLAEGPVWDAALERVLWVDISAGRVHEGVFADGVLTPTRQHDFASTVGAVVAARDGSLLVATRDRLVTIAGTGRHALDAPVLPPEKNSRFNDGGCDPAGRFLIGSLALDDRLGEEVLYRLEADGRATELDTQLSLSNGLCWSPDGSSLYSIDTTPGIVWVRDYDPANGSTGQRRLFLHLDGESPDGMCADADGNLWIAIYGAGQVRCYSPAGEQLAIVVVPAPNTTSVAFIGPELDTLLISTARQGLSGDQLARFPDSGRLFTAAVGVRGLPPTPWRGSG
ncbi:MAG: SMP-30/gluconolactonase/LRE family protein [Nakamurella sp.]